jgi:riboflavin kinase/FMN adenylyltransferase
MGPVRSKVVKESTTEHSFSIETTSTPTAVALGNFDGVHRGHQKVIRPILAVAGQGKSNTPGRNGQRTADGSQRSYTTVVTFNPHPQEFFSGEKRTLLTTLGEKEQILRSLGVEQLVVIPFDLSVAAMNPKEFVEQILVQQLQATYISIGENFHFGCQRSGNANDLKAIAATFGIEVAIVPLESCQNERISSSGIRAALIAGDLEAANRLLGRSYTLTGRVVAGQQLGRTIGFPTANLQLPPEKFLPCHGVYGVKVWLTGEGEGEREKERCGYLTGVMNIGQRPTVDGKSTTVEVHLLDRSPDLYGQVLTVSLEKFLRPEQKFANLTALKDQIAADCAAAREFFA